MNKQDVIDLLGEPDRITRGPMMTSTHWFCPTCAKLHTFATPVRPPSPCECGGIIFERRSSLQKRDEAMNIFDEHRLALAGAAECGEYLKAAEARISHLEARLKESKLNLAAVCEDLYAQNDAAYAIKAKARKFLEREWELGSSAEASVNQPSTEGHFVPGPWAPQSDCFCDACKQYFSPKVETDDRHCTCHPHDRPPWPCQRKYALTECTEAYYASKTGEKP